MKTFKDAVGREWTVQVNYSARVRVKAKTDPPLDLFGVGLFERIGDDPGLMIDVLAAVCAEQIEKAGITVVQFQDAITGDSIDGAADALMQEVIDFFPKRRREVLNKLLATANQAQEKAAELIQEKINSGEMLRELQKELTEPSGDSPASAASIQAPSPSASST